MRKLVAGASVVFFAIGIAAVSSRGDPKKVDDLMQRKLLHSQKLLEGIALGNFALITKQAEELIQISKTAEWRAVKSPQYELRSNEFRRTAETLIDKAKDKNLDGAVLAYMDMTMTCVKCHKHLRERRDTRLDGIMGANEVRQFVKK
jgi:hypothetical protein